MRGLAGKRRLKLWALGLLIVLSLVVGFPAPGIVPLGHGASQLLLQEDFEDGQAQGWEFFDGPASPWPIITEDGNHILSGEGHGWARFTGGAAWENYSFKLRVKLIKGTVHLNYRLSQVNGFSRYFIGFHTGGLYLSKQVGDHFTDLTEVGAFYEPNVWHEVEIKGYEGHLQVYVDGTMALEYVDNQPLARGTIALEILEDSHVFFDDLLVTALEKPLPPPRPVQEHHGPLVLKRNQEMRIEGMTYIQYGDIHLQDRAKLILRDAKLEIHAEGDPRADIFIEGQAQLIAENASLLPPLVHPDNLYLYASDQAQVHFDHVVFLNVLGVGGGAQVTITNSQIHSGAIGIPETEGGFGIIQLEGNARVAVSDSTIGSVGFSVGAGARLSVSGLRPGLFEHLKLPQAGQTGIGFRLELTNTTILPSIASGPFERGWTIFADPDAHLTISNSELNKFCLENVLGRSLHFMGLKLNQPMSLDYGGIHLKRVSVFSEWCFFVEDSELVIEDSEGVWPFLYGKSKMILRRSHMVEFDPRRFTGTLIFENSRWTTAGEIIEGNDFRVQGSVSIGEKLRQSLVWFTSRVVRTFEIHVQDAQGHPVPGATVELRRGSERVTGRTDTEGKALFDLPFLDGNYSQPWELQVLAGGKSAHKQLDFFTSTPLIVQL